MKYKITLEVEDNLELGEKKIDDIILEALSGNAVHVINSQPFEVIQDEKDHVKGQIARFCQEHYDDSKLDFSAIQAEEEDDEQSQNDDNMDFLHEIRAEFESVVREKLFAAELIKDVENTKYDDLISEEVWEWLIGQLAICIEEQR